MGVGYACGCSCGCGNDRKEGKNIKFSYNGMVSKILFLINEVMGL